MSWISLSKVENFRDFGGYPATSGHKVKKGIIFRSGNLDSASKEDLNAIRLLNIQSIIDLRTLKEFKKNPVKIGNEKKIHIPLSITEQTRERLKPHMTKKNSDDHIITAIDSVYRDMVELLKPKVGEIFKVLISKDAYPLLIHCHIGKDRTGFIIALIQMALQVEKKFIIQNYISTNDYLLPGTRRMLRRMRIATLGLVSTWNFELASLAQERFINTVMNIIDNNYHGINNYLAECGISENEITAIKNNIYENS